MAQRDAAGTAAHRPQRRNTHAMNEPCPSGTPDALGPPLVRRRLGRESKPKEAVRRSPQVAGSEIPCSDIVRSVRARLATAHKIIASL